MGIITVRTTDEIDAVLERVKLLMDTKTATSTLMKAVFEYEPNQLELKRLRSELAKAEYQVEKYRDGMQKFKAAADHIINLEL